ncbi:Dynactin subunit 3 like protein [Argiope bruennichi]|uniref:Dynactin subunit 3 like protein n=1 Tax=Argiope bruennichi TaxID=94029 RepID=A0A8T0ENS2_ARGBR|nr:Dynactin subunit 3 like protein [Argiope bruennichi]
MTDETSIDSIERRISKLEQEVYDTATSDSENKSIETLMNIHNRLQSAVTGREKITTLFSKLDDLQKYLDPSFKEHMTLTETAKLNLILLDAAELTSETRQLIANYDNLIMSLSKQFILWDSMLNEIEKGKIQKKKIPSS